MKGERNLSFWSVKRRKRVSRCILSAKKSRKRSVFVIYSYFKDGAFTPVKGCKVVNYCKYVKGVPFVDRR